MFVPTSKPSAIFVERADILDEIITDCPSPTHRGKGMHNKDKTKSKPHHSKELDAVRAQYLVKCQQEDAITRQSIKKYLENKSIKRDEKFVSNLEDIDKCNEFLDNINKNLHLMDEAKKNKTRRQFEEWNENVHGKIQMNIAKQINSIDSKELNRKKNEDYSKFIDISNKKAAIFRDIIIESEYDPLEVNRRAIKARVGFLKDPTHLDEIKARKESAMLDVDDANDNNNGNGNKQRIRAKSANAISRKVHTREVLSPELWASGKIEGTPYGAFAKIMETTATSQSRKNPTMQSSIHFDDFTFRRGKDVLDAEMPRGKRVYPTKSYPFGFCAPSSLQEAEIRNALRNDKRTEKEKLSSTS